MQKPGHIDIYEYNTGHIEMNGNQNNVVVRFERKKVPADLLVVEQADNSRDFRGTKMKDNLVI